MFVKISSAAVTGLSCVPVEVEVDLHKGQTNFALVGLADTAVKEAKDRLYSALKNSGYTYPFNFRLVVNLAPADTPKEGPSFDLPMAVGLVAASAGLIVSTEQTIVVGELALDGAVRHVSGVLAIALFAKEKNCALMVPAADAEEARLVPGLVVYPVATLGEAIDHLTGAKLVAPYQALAAPRARGAGAYDDFDFKYIRGQEFGKRALEIAAAGGHNILMSGPPGAGKTMLARAIPSILPELSTAEALEVTKIYSVAGLLSGSVTYDRPFRSPHHTASNIALIGGGSRPRPGEITLAHRGVLFLDEFPEFPRSLIESLRQPLEDGVITVARANGSVTFPARCMLVASQNPCPCGFYGDSERECVCTTTQLLAYHKRISGPILDRIDLHVEIPRLATHQITHGREAEDSAAVRARVTAARSRQAERLALLGLVTNSELNAKELKKFCVLGGAAENLLREAIEKLKLTARAYTRVLKVARTITDLAGAENIEAQHVAEALQYRTKGE